MAHNKMSLDQLKYGLDSKNKVLYEIVWVVGQSIQQVISEEFPQLSKDEINNAIMDCCGKISRLPVGGPSAPSAGCVYGLFETTVEFVKLN